MRAVDWIDGHIRFIDQTLLPHEERFVDTDDVRVVEDAIRSLAIRGAPAIGVAAAFGVVLAVKGKDSHGPVSIRQRVHEAVKSIGSTRPTAVNLFNALHRMNMIAERNPQASDDRLLQLLEAEAKAIQEEDIRACDRIGELGASLLGNGVSLLTHCNAGALATAGSGTALSVITTAARQGKVVRVFADETRPLLQGSRLTAWELQKAGIPVVLITDGTAASVLREGKVQAVIVGADRIAANGDAANKVGTYPLAVLANRHNVPFYVAAPTSTLDREASDGLAIPIEERTPGEVTHFAGVRVAPEGIGVYAPAFDVTPNELITAIVTEKEIFRQPYAAAIARTLELS
ncbi:MAG: S-methyl-5-thioribose-1-phosphate isomerase [Bacteroidetes bacterium]|nr:S-methyl-5-thioribose-1-phosphate isomerase [Bacteroidota bacterium]